MEIILPKIYHNDASGNYPQHIGKPKISYSQYTSWKDPLYRMAYIQQYFFGAERTSNIYADFGSACGGYFENKSLSPLLSSEDISVLDQLPRYEEAQYEGEIVLDCGEFVIQGFIDVERINISSGSLAIEDLKTGNVNSKVAFYGGNDYQQTTIYSHARKLEGLDIEYSGVILLGRKGNGENYGPLRLSGVIEPIPTPYSEDRAKKAIADIRATVYEISEVYQMFLKMNKIEH